MSSTLVPSFKILSFNSYALIISAWRWQVVFLHHTSDTKHSSSWVVCCGLFSDRFTTCLMSLSVIESWKLDYSTQFCIFFDIQSFIWWLSFASFMSSYISTSICQSHSYYHSSLFVFWRFNMFIIIIHITRVSL